MKFINQLRISPNSTDSQTYNEKLWESQILFLLTRDVPMDIFDDNNGRNLTLIEQYQSSDAVSQTRYVMYSGHSYLLFKKLEMQSILKNNKSLQASLNKYTSISSIRPTINT
jgi:hypothetical protein